MTYSNVHWVVGGTSSMYGYQAHAEYFVPSTSGYLSQIQLATIVEGGVPQSDISIAQDNGSGLPGTILESFNNVTDANNGILTINSLTTPLLQAGQTYWLCDRPAASSTFTGWYMNNQGLTGHDAFATTQSSQNWFNLGASGTADSVFSISVIPVPEPSTAGFVLLGAGFWATRRRQFSIPSA